MNTERKQRIRIINKLIEAGFADEQAIRAMQVQDFMTLQGITIGDIAIFLELQEVVKTNKVFSYLAGMEMNILAN